MRLLVFGASGQTGQELLRQALQRGHAVSAFVRDPAKLPLRDLSLRVIQGNVRDAAAVAAAMPQHDAVVSVLGVGIPLQHDPDVIAGLRHIIRAMQAQGIRRLIYLSFIGVRESRSAVGFLLSYIAPIPLRHEIADHEEKEALVRASGLDWTILRPPKLTGGRLSGRCRSGEHIRSWKPLPMLSRADLAHFILQDLAVPRYIGRAPRLLY